MPDQTSTLSPEEADIVAQLSYHSVKVTRENKGIEKGLGSAQFEHSPAQERIELNEAMCYNQLGYSFDSKKKWTIISVIFLVQMSMNFNASLYSNAVSGISEEFKISEQAARCGAMIFLVFYAFGCELWAPWSEELGRKLVLQLSLFLVNIWQVPVALAPNFATILVGRALGGLSSAGGSVTLGMIADLWEPDTQQYAIAAVVFSSVAGSGIGPVVGGFIESFLPWQWNIWVQLIFGCAVQVIHWFLVPETRATVLINSIAKKMREDNHFVFGPTECLSFSQQFSLGHLTTTWIRPFRMFFTEPIVLILSLISGYCDALIFMFIQSLSLVYDQWGFNTWQKGLAFIPILIGYMITWLAWFPIIRRNVRERKETPTSERAQYESRLWGLLYTAPLLPIGLIGFAWTSLPQCHWIGSMIFAVMLGVANYAIYMATIDYMICAYGPYSASATGGNGLMRDLLAGILTIPAIPFFTNIGGQCHLEYASTILCRFNLFLSNPMENLLLTPAGLIEVCISIPLVVAVYYVYWRGPVLRKRSPFAQQLEDARNNLHLQEQFLSKIPTVSRANSLARSKQDVQIRNHFGSQPGSILTSWANSRRGSCHNEGNTQA